MAATDDEIIEVQSSEVAEPGKNLPVTAKMSEVALRQEAEDIINQLITETDIAKTKDLTYLFNINQNKKTMVRLNKQSELMDILTDKTIDRVKNHPDELSNDDLNKLMKTIADLMEKGQNQINQTEDAPLIQVNQQNNEINMAENKGNLNRESREKVKAAVMALLRNAANGDTSSLDNIIDTTGGKKDD